MAALRAQLRRVDLAEVLRVLRRWLDGPLLVALAVGVAATAVFAELYESLREQERLVRIDRAVTDWLTVERGDVLTRAMELVTWLAAPAVVAGVVVAAVAVLSARRHAGSAAFLVASSAGAALLVSVAKLVVARPRPPAVDAVVVARGYSFPSGHAAQSVACYGALALIAWYLSDDRRVRLAVLVAAGLVAVAVGASRVVLGVHWTSDVIAGWALAAGWLALLVIVARARAIASPP